MPEGDTIYRTAVTLHRALAGQEVVAFDAPRLAGRRPAKGWRVDGVDARGKHLLVHFADGDTRLTLRTHLRMNGTWHLYRPGERWRKSPRAARVVIETTDAVAVCFLAPDVEVFPTERIDRHPELARLGPDLSRDDADLDAAVERMERLLPPATEIGVALLDQRIAAGVGNVYRSEVLHACGIDPSATVAELDRATRRRLLETASQQLRANLDGYPRVTVTGPDKPRLAVYDRAGRPCLVCGTRIEARRMGEQRRVVYWCPSCQEPGASG